MIAYPLNHGSIAGYGRPEWALVDFPLYDPGWHHDQNGWWYADADTSCMKSCRKVINGYKYYFDSDGYEITDWQQISSKWYYFDPRTGHPMECALYVTDSSGAQDIGAF